MKKYLLFLLLLLIVTNNLNSEWTRIYKDKNYSHYRCIDLECIGDRCIGIFELYMTYPMVRYTTDAGYTWTTAFVDSNEKIQLWDLDYVSNDLCIIGAHTGYYYVSTDGFETWELRKTDTNIIMGEIDFINERTGAYIYHDYDWDTKITTANVSLTVDGGDSWKNSTPDLSDISGTTIIDEINWMSEKDLYVFAFNYESRGFVFHSPDTGKTFSKIGTYQDRILDLAYLNNTDWVGVGVRAKTNKDQERYQIIYKTYDGGKTWEKKFDTLRNSKNSLKKVIFYDDKKGAAHTYTSWDMYYTFDGGETWHTDKKYDLDYGQGFGLDNNLSGCGFDSKGNLIGCGYLYGSVWRQDFVVGVDDLEELARIKIFPNPIQAGATATIVLDIEQQGMYQFSVYDTRGELVDQHKEFLHLSENRIDYTPEHLSTGMYYIHIEGGGGMTTVKLVVE
jgi:photosystem II stability/assembly factor-like uncharacterized protein